MPTQLKILRYRNSDADEVRDLFTAVNQLLAPLELKETFEAYISLSIKDEIGRIADYYSQRGGSFWVARMNTKCVGMFGLEAVCENATELRRMYVDPAVRRSGIASRMLDFAEDHCRSLNIQSLQLSTSELQQEALALYRNAGYQLQEDQITEGASNKTIGGGVRRYYFAKTL